MATMRNAGMFKPGQSGNPLGRPKSDMTIRDIARGFTREAITTLVEIASNPKASDSARVQAAVALLDRGWGKPPQYMESVTMAVSYQDYLSQIAKEELLDEV